MPKMLGVRKPSRTNAQLGGVFILISVLIFIGTTGVLFAMGLAGGEVGISHLTLGELRPLASSSEEADFIMVLQHKVGTAYGVSQTGCNYPSGSSITTASIPTAPTCQYHNYYLYSSFLKMPYYCRQFWSGTSACSSAEWWTSYNETMKESPTGTTSKLFAIGQDTWSWAGLDWRVKRGANNQFLDFNDAVDNNTQYEKFQLGDLFQSAGLGNYSTGDIIFAVFRARIPVEVGEDTYVSLIKSKPTSYSNGAQRLTGDIPVCACAYAGTGTLENNNAWIMDEWAHFHFGPCGTEIPPRDMDPVSETTPQLIVSGGGLKYYAPVYDYGETVELSKAEIRMSGGSVVNDVTVGLEVSSDNVTWTGLIETPQGWSSKESEFSVAPEARYVRAYARWDSGGQTFRGPYYTTVSYKLYALNQEYEKYYEYYTTYGCNVSAPPMNDSEDSDNDGMRDEWEEDNNVDNPYADDDNDGITNRDEFQQGTDPQDAGDYNTPMGQVAEVKEGLIEGDPLWMGIGAVFLIFGILLATNTIVLIRDRG